MTVDQLVGKNVEAKGGAEALRALQIGQAHREDAGERRPARAWLHPDQEAARRGANGNAAFKA